jgi:NitT/TauT family transport system substrate-binding protein
MNNNAAGARHRAIGRQGSTMGQRIFALFTLFTVLSAAGAPQARAETNELRISRGYGIHYLALYVMEKLRLVEKHAAAAGLGDIKVNYRVIDGGNIINDAMLSGSLDIATGGVPGFLQLWDKTLTLSQNEVRGLCANGAGSVWLITRNPAVKTLADFTEKDRIAVPGIKTSFVAVVLEMAVAQAMGKENYAKLDPLTVGLPHPEALKMMLSGKTEVTAHFSSPPFSYIEYDQPGFHRVINSADVFGPQTIIMAYATRKFFDANPKVSAAFVVAMKEAARFIAANKREAARIYIELAAVKPSESDMMRMLADPDTHYAAAPEGVMRYAGFLHEIGRLKSKPAGWKDLFFLPIHDQPGN